MPYQISYKCIKIRDVPIILYEPQSYNFSMKKKIYIC